jgi:hypothetical protein
LWSLYCVLFPIWVGPSHLSLPTDQVRAPIWSPPPRADMHNVVRWPWQQTSHACVDFAVVRNCASWTLGLFLLGLIYRGFSWNRPLKKPDLILSIGWSVSLSLVLAWVCILPTLFPFIRPNGTLTITVLCVGIIAGSIVGLGAHWFKRFKLETKPFGTDLTLEQMGPDDQCSSTIDPAMRSPLISSWMRHLYKTIFVALVWPIAFAVHIAAGFVASFFVDNQSYYGSSSAAGRVGLNIGITFILFAPGIAYHLGAKLDHTTKSIKGFVLAYFFGWCIAPLLVLALAATGDWLGFW